MTRCRYQLTGKACSFYHFAISIRYIRLNLGFHKAKILRTIKIIIITKSPFFLVASYLGIAELFKFFTTTYMIAVAMSQKNKVNNKAFFFQCLRVEF